MRRGPIPYSTDEMAWLKANYRLVISDYHAAFVAEFGRTDVSLTNLNQLRKRKGWKVGRDGSRYVGRLKAFSPAEIAWLSENRAMRIGDYDRAFRAAFDRPDITKQKLHALRKRQGWKTGRTGQFEPGQEPLNKGKSMHYNANSAATRFKKGNAPHNTNYLGHERVSKDGYVEISVAETNPHTGFERRYVLKHRWLWEQANGAIPDGHALKCLDGDRLNTDPLNWEAVPRGVLARLNGGRWKRSLAYDDAAAELKPLVMATAKLKHQVSQRRKAPTAKRSAA